MSLKIGDEITVVTNAPFKDDVHGTIRAHVGAFLQGDIFRWFTDWQAEGHCSLSNEGTTWVRGYVDEPEQLALLASFALEAGRG